MEEAENIVSALTAGSWSVLWPTLLVVFVAIVGVYFHARIKKSGELTEINNNFSRVFEQQRQLVNQSEEIRHALAKDSIYYQAQIGAYREKSVASIDLVYRELLKLKRAARNTSFLLNDSACDEFTRAVSLFRDLFEDHRIWLPHSLAEKIENLAQEIDRRCNKYIMASKRLEAPKFRSREKIDKLCNVQEQFYDYINQEVGSIFSNLAVEIADQYGASA